MVDGSQQTGTKRRLRRGMKAAMNHAYSKTPLADYEMMKSLVFFPLLQICTNRARGPQGGRQRGEVYALKKAQAGRQVERGKVGGRRSTVDGSQGRQGGSAAGQQRR